MYIIIYKIKPYTYTTNQILPRRPIIIGILAL